MRFVLTPEQRMFAETLHELLSSSDVPAAAREWAQGHHEPGRKLWSALGQAGVFALAVDEEHGGAGVLPVELVTAMIEIGRHAVPGPIVETLTTAILASEPEHLPALADGTLMATLAHPPDVPHALDADAADLVLLLDNRDHIPHRATPGELQYSIDPTRRLFTSTDTTEPGTATPACSTSHARQFAALACAAQALGVGRHLLAATVDYATTREQFGRPIGEFQAVKHHLVDAHMGLEFAQPLVYGAALSYGHPEFGRDTSAANVAAVQAAYTAAKTALQVHGAIGYTEENDLSLWIRKARALYAAWGTPARHREQLMAELSA